MSYTEIKNLEQENVDFKKNKNPEQALKNKAETVKGNIEGNRDLVDKKIPAIQALCERGENSKFMKATFESQQCGFPQIFEKYNLS